MNNKPSTLKSKTDSFRIRRGSDGFALAMMLCVIVILLIIGMGVLALGMQSRGSAVRTTSEMVARCAADAGVTKALFEMNEKLKVIPWNGSQLPKVTSEALPNSDAIYSYAVTGNLVNGYGIKSKGIYGLRDKTINCSLSLVGLFESAILTKQTLILKAGMLVDGYNSDDPTDKNIDVHIATLSTLPGNIILNPGVAIKGNVAVGVGGNVGVVVKDLGASMYRKYSMLQDVEMPLISPPTLADTGSGINAFGKTVKVGPTDTGQYDKINLKKAVNPGILEINGGDVVLYITGDISLGQECEIVIKKGSTLILYLDGDIVAGNNAGFNNEGVPSSFKLFGTSTEEQKFDLKAKGNGSLGAIYAPNATVTIMAKGDIYGAITAKSVEFKSGGNFYYDKALSIVGTDDEAVRFVIREWHEE